jgi:uncharacterized membrane protein
MSQRNGMYYQPRGTVQTHNEEQDRAIASHDINISQPERTLSLLGAAGTIAAGIAKRGPLGVALMALGGYLGYRGMTGHCYVNEALGVNTAEREPGKKVSVPHQQGIRVDKSITVNRPVDELFAFWRNFENLPRIMVHLESVTVTGDGTRSHWVAKAPAGLKVEWDAEIINEIRNERIGWRSLEGASVPNAGAVIFRPAPQGQGTEIQVSLKYDPPGGAIGAAIAKLFGEEPAQQIQEDLYRFRQLMETGEIATISGQTSGRDKDSDLRQKAAQDPQTQTSNGAYTP